MKKCWFPALVAFVLMGCADATTNVVVPGNQCGNGVVDITEKCDTSVPVMCSQFDSTRNWQAGGAAQCNACNQILQGSCVEIANSPVCGNNAVEAGEKCDKAQAVSCQQFDNTKIWQAGGVAACSDDCTKILVGSCVERQLDAGTCGDGVLNTGEVCDKDDGTSCSNYDPSKQWEDAGKALCAPDCKSLTIGSCVEKKPVIVTCEDQGKVTCKGQCKEPCQNGSMDENCECQSIIVDATCEEQGKVTCNDQCYDPCENGKELDANCECPQDIVVPETSCAGNGDCKDEKLPVCDTTSGKCVANRCGDGFVFGNEVCEDSDPASFASMTCKDFNDKADWKDGGKPGCSNCQLTAGSCEAIPPQTCGDGNLDNGEECDPKKPNSFSNVTCSSKLGQQKWVNDLAVTCSDGCLLDYSACKVDTCGNGIVDDGEQCDLGMAGSHVAEEKNCADIDPAKWTSGKITCTNACKKTTNTCEYNPEAVKTGLYWCQLMEPVVVEFSDTLKAQKMTVRYGIGSDITETAMKAQLVVGTDFKQMPSWKTVDAAQNAAGDEFTASLTREFVEAVLSKDGAHNAYYTFRISPTGKDADYVYCKANSNGAGTIDASLTPYTVEAEKIGSNANQSGVATIAVVSTGNILAKFNFDDKKKYQGGKPDNNGLGFAADEGTGIIAGAGPNITKYTCPSSNCFSGGVTGSSFGIGGFKKNRSEAVSDGNRFLISKVVATGAENINLDFQVKRNKIASSPDKLVVRYSTDGKVFVDLNADVDLASDEQFHPVSSIELPKEVNNAAELYIELIPYGVADGMIKLDDVIISKDN